MQLLDVFPQGLGFVLVFEFMPSGLWEMLRDAESPLSVPQVKTYMIMLLKGVTYLHEHSIMHRVRHSPFRDYILIAIYSKHQK
jgi:cell cycle related kinase